MKRWQRIFIIVPIVMLGCSSIGLFKPKPTPIPLPGWRIPVGELLLDTEAFPTGWVHERDIPPDLMVDPNINHVYRSWWGKAHGSGMAEQSIWRAYTVDDARDKYNSLDKGEFNPHLTPHPVETYIPYQPPPDILFQSQTADEYYLACGWRRGSYCKFIARYHNYVVYMRFELKGDNQGYYSDVGLTYLEIEAVLEAMDEKFVQFFAGLVSP